MDDISRVSLFAFLPFILLSDWKRLNCIKACHKNWANIILPSLYVFDRLYDIMLSQGYNYSSINVATQFQLNCISFSMYVDTKRIYVYQKCKLVDKYFDPFVFFIYVGLNILPSIIDARNTPCVFEIFVRFKSEHFKIWCSLKRYLSYWESKFSFISGIRINSFSYLAISLPNEHGYISQAFMRTAQKNIWLFISKCDC